MLSLAGAAWCWSVALDTRREELVTPRGPALQEIVQGHCHLQCVSAGKAFDTRREERECVRGFRHTARVMRLAASGAHHCTRAGAAGDCSGPLPSSVCECRQGYSCVAFDTRQGRCVAASRANRQELIERKAWQRYVNWLHQRLQRLQAVVHSGGWGTRGRQRHGNILDPQP